MTTGGDLDDQLIVQQTLQGNTELFRFLVQRHEKAVFGMGMSFFRNREDAADFTQEVFLKAYRSLPQFQGKARFSTWLYKIAYNTGINGVNRRKEYQSLAEGQEIPDFDDPEKQALMTASREAVKKAVADLPERYRICVDLFFFYDRSYQEIEAVTGFPVNTIKSHVFRAKKMLQEQLGQFTEGGI
ncbi:RNA polymerase sigma factor [Breznakiella homolactica]|uniref:Sigma-70 family RNA polymerase sigma factor n=1 Tax=Breznakiella homolactica TaxID=2798577 RepID=A0A7T8BBP5_9SPIR|nr:sigma-70 family RNA polymerase sigma factor [Breznakiella homolactica]QQO09423.1 sigma-70 family RNA polymerase sigma factor [Breznakiella homolactica]